jgi:cell division protein FtsW
VAEKKSITSGYDYMILIPVIFLIAMGLVLVYSASSHLSAHRLGDSYFFLKRQAVFLIFGIGLMIAAKNIPCTLYSRLVYPLLLISFCLLILLFIPGLGSKVGGATRWLRFGGFTFQPSELAKFSLAVYMAYSMSEKLILFSPAIFWLVRRADYRIGRLLAYINPWDDPSGLGYQIIHSFLAFGSGGIFGQGLGGSKQKLFYLPEPHTDFILSIAAEEVGFIGVIAIIIMFGLLIGRGIKLSLDARDLYSSYLALGLTCLIGLQVLVNIGVVMGLLPTKGLTLPLISYGGSSLLITLLSVGILLNISSRT